MLNIEKPFVSFTSSDSTIMKGEHTQKVSKYRLPLYCNRMLAPILKPSYDVAVTFSGST